MTRNKIVLIIKVVLSASLSLLWFFLIQGEYEMVAKPILQNDFPIFKGISAVYLLGIILVIISSLILYLFFSIIKKPKL